jgi:multidrug efflux pump
VVVSGFVALTLTPMLCSKLLRHNPNPHWFDRTMEHALTALANGYGRLLRRVLGGWRWAVGLVMLGCAVAIAVVYPSLRQELSPLEDRGMILASINAPDGATLAYTDRYARELARIGERYPEFDRIFANVGNPTVSQGSVMYRAVDWSSAGARRWTSPASCSRSSTASPASTPSPSRRRRWARAFASGR